MGLSASQARLLTITARKADCEFRSMSLSHQKIALSRDLERITDEYQNATSKTKLVYDFYGTGASQMNLNYGLLMTPSVYNDYLPRFITDRQNRVVLSPEYANAARFAGIPQEGYNGTPSSEIRNLFVEGLKGTNVISSTTAANIESVVYNDGIGLGTLVQASQATTTITYDDFMNRLSTCLNSKDYGLYLGKIPESCNDFDWDLSLNCDNDEPYATHPPNVRIVEYDSNGNLIGTYVNSDNKQISLNDLLKSDATHYVISLDPSNGPCVPIGETAVAQQMIVGQSENSVSFLNWMTDCFSSILGGVEENDLAIQYAYDQIVSMIYPNEKIQDLAEKWRNIEEIHNASPKTQTRETDAAIAWEAIPLMNEISAYQHWCCNTGPKAINIVANGAKNYIGFVHSHTDDDNTNNYTSVAVDLTTLAQVFMTAFMEYRDGGSYNYSNKMLTSDATLYTPKSTDKFTVVSSIDIDSGEENLNAQFYDAMFNLICTSGWTENQNINNAEYMQELLKNGAIYISAMDNDACYYQSSYKTDTYIHEVTDSEAVAQAEAKYNALKASIENKENTIDMKMKSLDTEISSLTTEYDTMKSVISKTIEKSFKRYDA